jgi:hypothetical protein
LFKAGAIVLVVSGLVHSLSLINKQVPTNATERQLFDLMSNYKFNVMGSIRSMGDVLRGFSISFMLAALGFGTLDLMMSRERDGILKRLAMVNAIWLAAMTVVSLKYFFLAPTSFMAAGLLLFALAWAKLPVESKA